MNLLPIDFRERFAWFATANAKVLRRLCNGRKAGHRAWLLLQVCDVEIVFILLPKPTHVFGRWQMYRALGSAKNGF